jgi:hypothetical protein
LVDRLIPRLPSSADLVRAFLADLSTVLDVGQEQDLAVSFTFVSSAIVITFTPDRDYVLVGAAANAGVIISTNAALTFANVQAATSGPRSDILWVIVNPTSTATGLAIPLAQGTKYSLVSNGGCTLVIYLRPLPRG